MRADTPTETTPDRPLAEASAALKGRPPSTTPDKLTAVALELFSHNGFDATTVNDIAAAAGVSRRTIFRYYSSKNDLVWGDFSAQLERFRVHLRSGPADRPLMTTVRRSIVAFNDYGPAALPELRTRMRLITTVPTLQAHATMRYAEWCSVVAEYVGERLGVPADDLIPATLAQAALGASIATFRVWVDRDGDLLAQLDEALALVAGGFSDEVLGLAGA